MTQNSVPKTCEKKLKIAELKVSKLINKIDSLKLSNSLISKLDISGRDGKNKSFLGSWKISSLVTSGILLAVVIGFFWIYNELFTNKKCIVAVPAVSKSTFRPPEDCSMCIGVNDVIRLANISAQDFEEFYAYGASPVIVTDATEDWLAMKEFDFKFFSNFYRYGKMGKQTNDCFYFAYKSGLNSLQEVFNMDEVRANLSGEPWYVGWSTCYDDETRNLRTYYNRPYFLPQTAESDMVDWIFMGGPGEGAHMHVDSVKHMSWQAQIRGRKRWELAPPPECFYQCVWTTFTVEPGEILVVDTNRWYHKTNVLPGDISITIGAEYD